MELNPEFCPASDMPPHHRSRPRKGLPRGKDPKREGPRVEPKHSFDFSRTQDMEYVDDPGPEKFSGTDRPREKPDGESEAGDEVGYVSADEQELSSSDNEESTPTQSYANLLRALKAKSLLGKRPPKRRKLDHKNPENGNVTQVDGSNEISADLKDEESDPAELDRVLEDDDSVASEEQEREQDSDDEEALLQDPFEQHFANVSEADLNHAIEKLSEKQTYEKTLLGDGTRKTSAAQTLTGKTKAYGKLKDIKIKRRLDNASMTVRAALNAEETDVFGEICNYRDVLCGFRSHQNASRLREILTLHALNHLFKTRDRVIKNNAKLSQETDGDGEYRDQGFTRPKVLFLVPTKQACVRFVDSIVSLSEPEQQENRGRFMDTFSQPEDDSFGNKPEDFRELFGGNHEEDFRVGLKFTRKTIKLFSGFYNSDIIIASPLGLMRTVTTGGGRKDEKSKHDADFLSSIEIVVVDHTNALEMQNWQHVDYVFSQLNLLPKESHGCDFARARNWYLDGKAKYLRQTVILSDYLTPSISSLASTYLHNVAGRVKYTPTYRGVMLNISPSLPLMLTQTFLRFDSLTPQTDSDVRFKFFTATILPSLIRHPKQSRGTIVFTPSYLDFVRLRNHFSTAQETSSLSFGTISEYSGRGDVARSRAHFQSGRHSLLLYSERAHHYFRYKLKGVRRIIFYGVPENPIFWQELVDMLGINALNDLEWAQSQRSKQGKGLVRALFSKWDMMKLERVVGTERVGRLVSDREGDIFEFA